MRRLFGTALIDYLPALGLLVITVLYLTTAYGYDARARELPVAYGWVMLALLVLDLVSRTKTPTGHALLNFLNPAAEETHAGRYPLLRQLSAIFWVLLFTAMLVFIGVLYAVPIYVFASMRFHGKRSLLTALISAVLMTAFTYLLFKLALRVDLYPGLLFSDY